MAGVKTEVHADIGCGSRGRILPLFHRPGSGFRKDRISPRDLNEIHVTFGGHDDVEPDSAANGRSLQVRRIDGVYLGNDFSCADWLVGFLAK